MPSAPQPLTPRSVRPSRPKRRFSLEQANSTLPLVKRIVRDIVRTHSEVLKCQQQLERATGARQQQRQQPAPTPQETQGQLERHMTRLEDYVEELTEVGAELKDYQMGLIDFIGRHQGHDVCLCWKLGEERIAYWHELDAGFAGRQPVASLKEKEKE
jgi:hypothetical protein